MVDTADEHANGRYKCPTSDCEADEYMISCTGDAPPSELGVLVDIRGNPTNRWEDGVAGVPEDVKAWIRMDDCAPYCIEHDQETEWHDHP